MKTLKKITIIVFMPVIYTLCLLDLLYLKHELKGKDGKNS